MRSDRPRTVVNVLSLVAGLAVGLAALPAGAAPEAAPIEGVKWQPGHYYSIKHKGETTHESVRKWLSAEPGFRGAHVIVNWRHMESKEAGLYDFSLRDQLFRLHRETAKFMKHTIVAQSMNFLINAQTLSDLAQVISESGVGGLTGPDMVPRKYASGRPTPSYRVLETFKDKVAILPEGCTSGLQLGETQAVFDLTVDVFGAHMKLWKDWHRDSPDYFTTEVLPVLRKENWRINTKKPSTLCRRP